MGELEVAGPAVEEKLDLEEGAVEEGETTVEEVTGAGVMCHNQAGPLFWEEAEYRCQCNQVLGNQCRTLSVVVRTIVADHQVGAAETGTTLTGRKIRSWEHPGVIELLNLTGTFSFCSSNLKAGTTFIYFCPNYNYKGCRKNIV